MKSSAKKVELASVDDLFSTEESRADAQREKVLEIPLSELHPFKDHPFKVKDDEAMMETADSIRQYGVLVPAIARPDPNGGYEPVARHPRHPASAPGGRCRGRGRNRRLDRGPVRGSRSRYGGGEQRDLPDCQIGQE